MTISINTYVYIYIYSFVLRVSKSSRLYRKEKCSKKDFLWEKQVALTKYGSGSFKLSEKR